MGKPILVPKGDVTSLGSAIFAFLAAGSFRTIEEAQDALCPGYLTVEPEESSVGTYRELYSHFRKLYFSFGARGSNPIELGDVLPELRRIAGCVRGGLGSLGQMLS
jgi:L-ribulokinase